MTAPVIRWLIALLWLAWLVYWAIAARDVKSTKHRQRRLRQLCHSLALIGGGFLYAAPALLPAPLRLRFVPQDLSFSSLGVVLVALGLAIAVWARRHLGRNWSGTVALKEQHTLVCSGPYRVVRHPIYGGVLLALLGTAIASGEWHALAGFAVMLLVFLDRTRLEEALMAAAFPGQYERYRGASGALLPRLF